MVDFKIEPLAEDEHTKYERARLIGARALQISMGAPFCLPLEVSKGEKKLLKCIVGKDAEGKPVSEWHDENGKKVSESVKALAEKKLGELKFNPVELAKLEFENDVLPIEINRKSNRK